MLSGMELPVLKDNSAVLPPLYAAWMGELLGGPIPAETEATCDDCAMCDDGTSRPAGTDYVFDPRTKCCTYIPEIPNFLVGTILSDEEPDFAAGKATLEARLELGVAVMPIGIGISPTEHLLYQHTSSAEAFGRNPELRCPHYLEEADGTCGIWKHRAATCSTWFCKHVRGAVGFRFWRSLSHLLALVEIDLQRWCVLELDIGGEALHRVFPTPRGEPLPGDPFHEGRLDGRLPPDVREAMWGNWSGREREFFQECGRLVEPLTWSEVTAICGPQMKISEHLTTQAYKNLVSNELPDSLRVGAFQMVRMGQNSHRIKAYSPLDPIEIPQALMQALPHFDGRPTAEAMQAIARETGLQIDESLVRKLVDFGILVR